MGNHGGFFDLSGPMRRQSDSFAAGNGLDSHSLGSSFSDCSKAVACCPRRCRQERYPGRFPRSGGLRSADAHPTPMRDGEALSRSGGLRSADAHPTPRAPRGWGESEFALPFAGHFPWAMGSPTWRSCWAGADDEHVCVLFGCWVRSEHDLPGDFQGAADSDPPMPIRRQGPRVDGANRSSPLLEANRSSPFLGANRSSPFRSPVTSRGPWGHRRGVLGGGTPVNLPLATAWIPTRWARP
jgi:hypothetical protein